MNYMVELRYIGRDRAQLMRDLRNWLNHSQIEAEVFTILQVRPVSRFASASMFRRKRRHSHRLSEDGWNAPTRRAGRIGQCHRSTASRQRRRRNLGVAVGGRREPEEQPNSRTGVLSLKPRNIHP